MNTSTLLIGIVETGAGGTERYIADNRHDLYEVIIEAVVDQMVPYGMVPDRVEKEVNAKKEALENGNATPKDVLDAFFTGSERRQMAIVQPDGVANQGEFGPNNRDAE